MTSDAHDRFVLRTGSVEDAGVAAALHAGQITEGFLTALGPSFLRRLYRRITRSPGSFLLIAEDRATAVGFLAGSTDVTSLYRSFVLRDGAAAALAGGAHLLRSWPRVVETLRHGTGASAEGAELLAIAVDPAVRGRGAGTLLVNGFLAEIGLQGQDAAHVVVGADNETSIALYRRAGFQTAQRFQLHAGTESLLMEWATPPTPDT